jgi:hypothetical protein
MEVLRTSAGAAAVARVAHLMENAASEHVQLGAAQWMAGIEGVSPIARQEIAHKHSGTAPGLVINLVDYSQAPQIAVIDQPAIARPAPGGLPSRVRHPSEVTIAGKESGE